MSVRTAHANVAQVTSARYLEGGSAQCDRVLTRAFDLLAMAPGGVAKLRELIRLMGVSGKLRQSVDEGVAVPWRWTTIGDLNPDFQNGESSRGTLAGVSTVVVRLADIKDRRISLREPRYVEVAKASLAKYSLAPGDILVVRVNGSADIVGQFVLVDKPLEAIYCDHFIRLRLPSQDLTPAFLSLLGECSLVRDRIKQLFITTAGQKTVNQGHIRSIEIPVPPLAEQHRIVARVEELMRLCDALEAKGQLANAQHARLVSTLFDALTRSQSQQELVEHWQRISAHFDLLLDRPEAIDVLEQTILQLAVRGLLVPQDPSDEPASELLDRIRAEKDLLVACGKIKRPRVLPSVNLKSVPFDLPSGWAWARFPELGEFGRGKSKHRPRNDPALFNPGIYPLIQTGEVARSSGVIQEIHSHYSEVGLAQSKLWPAGTMCITIAANIADAALLGFEACFPDSVVGFVPSPLIKSTEYFLYFMRTARERLIEYAPATAQKNINLEILESVLIPVPPSREVARIVTRVQQLRALCAQLRERLQAARATQSRLAQALVEQAVA